MVTMSSFISKRDAVQCRFACQCYWGNTSESFFAMASIHNLSFLLYACGVFEVTRRKPWPAPFHSVFVEFGKGCNSKQADPRGMISRPRTSALFGLYRGSCSSAKRFDNSLLSNHARAELLDFRSSTSGISQKPLTQTTRPECQMRQAVESVFRSSVYDAQASSCLRESLRPSANANSCFSLGLPALLDLPPPPRVARSYIQLPVYCWKRYR